MEEMILVYIIGAFFAFILIVVIVLHFKEFNMARQYLIMEIRRTDGSERLYWQRELKELYLNLIPLRAFIIDKIRNRRNQ